MSDFGLVRGTTSYARHLGDALTCILYSDTATLPRLFGRAEQLRNRASALDLAVRHANDAHVAALELGRPDAAGFAQRLAAAVEDGKRARGYLDSVPALVAARDEAVTWMARMDASGAPREVDVDALVTTPEQAYDALGRGTLLLDRLEGRPDVPPQLLDSTRELVGRNLARLGGFDPEGLRFQPDHAEVGRAQANLRLLAAFDDQAAPAMPPVGSIAW